MKKTLLVFCLLFSGCFGSSEINIEKELEQKIEEKIEIFNKSQIDLLNFHNKERKLKGIEDLKLDKKLCDYAQKHAEIMAKKDSLYHSNMSNLIKVNTDANTVGENIAFGQVNENKVVKDWLNSTGHRWNILSKKYKRVGFGKVENYWCAVLSN
jgi:uncharacterized protein YkwD